MNLNSIEYTIHGRRLNTTNFRSVLTPNGAVTLKRSVSEIYVPNRLQNVRPLRVPLGHIFDVPKKIPNLHSAYQQETNINW